MARIRIFVVFAMALAAGGTFAYGTYQYMQNVPTRTVSIPTQSVMVAAANLNLGAELRREDVRAIQWPKDAVPEGAFTSPDDLIGRGLIQSVTQNEPFLPAKLASKGAGSGLPPVIPNGFRAMSVRVNDVVGVAGYVLPGTRVDVLATVNPSRDVTDVTSKVILTNVQVLTAGTRIERDSENNEPISVSVVTLVVSPEEAERLTLASTEGKIQLALRNPLDQTAPQTFGIKPAVLMGSGIPARPAVRRAAAAPPAPVTVAAATPAPNTVEIIRGDQRATVVVSQE